MTKKILYIFDANDWQSRIPVAEEANSRGFDVTLCVIGETSKTSEFKTVNLAKPTGIKSAIKFLPKIFSIIKHQKPNTLHTVTLKYAFVCGLVSLPNPKMKKIFTLAGLGYLFHGHSVKSKILQLILQPLLKLVFTRPNTKLIFQNPDDMALLLQKKYTSPLQSILIRGSGVDLSRFNTNTIPQNLPLVLMPTRLVHEKGIQVFIDAAKILSAQNTNAIFQIAGGETTHNPRAITKEQMQEMLTGSPVEWLGRVDDIPALLARATLIVYPSYYGEGIPRVLLESCAAGRPIVTTDHTGCREAVTHGQNGFLVPVRNPHATAQAIAELLKDPEKLTLMGQESRKHAETFFDIRHIAAQTVDVYGIN